MSTLKLAILVHGFNVTKPERTIGKLKPHFEQQGYKVVMFRYGHFGLWDVYKKNEKTALDLACLIDEYTLEGYEVQVVCHSNGAAITHLATAIYNANVSGVVCINAALRRHINPAPDAKFVHVYYNDEDRAVKFGKWLRWLTPYARRARPWGEMGRHGYSGSDANLTNFDSENDFQTSAVGHSGVFKNPEVKFFGPVIAYKAMTS